MPLGTLAAMADGSPVSGEPDTAVLARRLRDGDREAVRELYRAFGAAVFAVCRRPLGSRALAEEALQQTFVQAWRAAARIDPERDLRPWVFTLARRAAIDVARREQARHCDELSERSLPDPVAGDSIERAWAAWRVREAVDRLPADEREVVRLQHVAGLSHVAIAEHLGVPVGTVKSRSHRAHQRLARQLSVLGEAD